MSEALLEVAVVGHTNTGKTSLMRTLMRDIDFGEVSDRPAVTRVVEAAVLSAGGRAALRLYDTPGLEDSIGLLEHLESSRADRRRDGIDVVREFLGSPEAATRFSQEAKALRQLLECDVALYVVDARDRVMAKHRDELEILGWCARPVVPVLNFTASPEANTAAWREHLARVNMHAVAEFDTVVYEERDERRLFEKMRTLLDTHAATLDALIDDRRRQREALVRASALLLAGLAVDVAAHVITVPSAMDAEAEKAMDELRAAVREREQQCVDDLLALHRFRPGDVEAEGLPIEEGRWGMDLFSPEALKSFGIRAGGAAATGAMVGLTLDVMLAGLSLGTGAAAGAAIGGIIAAGRAHGRRIVDRARGRMELRCNEATLRLLVARQMELIAALLARGHASVDVIRIEDDAEAPAGSPKVSRAVMTRLARARVHPSWSALAAGEEGGAPDGPARQELIERLADALADELRPAPPGANA
jgi:hypothetical protein